MPLFQNGVGAWDVTSNQEAFRISDIGWVDEVAWSPDGEHLLASIPYDSEPRIVVFDRSGAVVATLREDGLSAISARFDPSGGRVAVLGSPEDGGGVTFWDWTGRVVVGRIPTTAQMVAFAPDGGTLATGFGDATVVDASTGAPSLTLEGQPMRSENDVAYSPDGNTIGTASADGRVRLFDTRSGALRLTLDAGDGEPVGRLAFSPDGAMLATQSPGLVRVWALDITTLLDIARTRTTRQLSEEECRQFLHLPTCQPSAGAGS